MEKLDFLVFIGRFMPFHQGHLKVVRTALQKCDTLILLIGSSNCAPTSRNPLSAAQRIDIIKSFLSDEEISRIKFCPINDYTYNNVKWITSVRSVVMSAVWKQNMTTPSTIGLIGHDKDHSSFYLKMFPGWKSIAVDNYEGLDASTIREYFYENGTLRGFKYYADHPAQYDIIEEELKKHPSVREEYHFAKQYKKQWDGVKYGVPTFSTTDALVQQAGHILLVTRKAMPGKGLYALPGGFLEKNLTLLDNTIKELREETRLKVPESVLKGSLVSEKTFDDPYRSSRGRTVTTCFRFDLKGENLEKVKGGDDAKTATWVPLDKVLEMEHMFFEDHYHMIRYMLGI